MNEYEKKNAQEHSTVAHSGNDEKQNVSRQSNEAHPHEEEEQHMNESSNEVNLREEETQHVSGPSKEMQSDEHEKQNNQYEKSKKSSSFFSMVMSGLVGAALILLLIMNTSFLDGVIAHKNNDDASNEAKVNDHVSDESAVPAQAPTKIDSNAVADMVEEASKAIVGITNGQQVNH